MKKYLKSTILVIGAALTVEIFYYLMGVNTPTIAIKLCALAIFIPILANTMYKNERY